MSGFAGSYSATLAPNPIFKVASLALSYTSFDAIKGLGLWK